MKKTGLILLLLIYSISSFGVTIREFYCCGKLKTVTYTLAAISKEKCNSGDENTGCCKTIYQQFKVRDSHFGSGEVTAPQSFITDVPTVFGPLTSPSLLTHEMAVINESYFPPGRTPIYIQNRVFRI